MSTPIAVLDLDLTGLNPANRINNEPQVLAGGTVRLLIPAFGSFYTTGLVIKDADTNTPLTDNQYQLMDFNQEAVLDAGKEIYDSIVVTDPTVSNNVTVTYQALGGPYSRNRKDFCPWIVMIKRLFFDWINVSCCSYSIGYSRELAVKVHPDAAIPGLAWRDSALLGAKPTFDHGI